MEFPPQKFREMVFQLLFSFDGGGGAETELIPFLMRELEVSKKNVSLAYQKALKIWEERLSIDAIIAKQSKEYSFERIKTVEKNALRIALYEMLHESELSVKIVIAEAYRISKKFGSDEGAAFVNAVLDGIELPVLS